MIGSKPRDGEVVRRSPSKLTFFSELSFARPPSPFENQSSGNRHAFSCVVHPRADDFELTGRRLCHSYVPSSSATTDAIEGSMSSSPRPSLRARRRQVYSHTRTKLPRIPPTKREMASCIGSTTSTTRQTCTLSSVSSTDRSREERTVTSPSSYGCCQKETYQ